MDPRPEGRNFMEISHLGLSVSVSLTLCILSVCGSLCLFLSGQEEDTLMLAEQGTVLSREECPQESFIFLFP